MADDRDGTAMAADDAGPPAELAALTWLGHSSVLLEFRVPVGDRSDTVRLLTDPVLRDHVGPLRRVGAAPRAEQWSDLDGVLISHLHHDHLDRPSLRRIDARVPIVGPRGSAQLLAKRWTVRELLPGDQLDLAGLPIRAVRAHHPGDRFGTRVAAPALGYLIGRTYFAGDTGVFAELAELAGLVDVALLPIGGWGLTLGSGHLDPRQAAEVTALIAPRLVVPIHWGSLFLRGAWHLNYRRSRDAGQLFAQAAAQLAPATEAVVLRPGQRIVMP